MNRWLAFALLAASCGGPSDRVADKSESERDAFCAQHAVPTFRMGCTGLPTCTSYFPVIDCTGLLDMIAADASCDATFADVIECIESHPCSGGCTHVCDVTVWRYETGCGLR